MFFDKGIDNTCVGTYFHVHACTSNRDSTTFINITLLASIRM